MPTVLLLVRIVPEPLKSQSGIAAINNILILRLDSKALPKEFFSIKTQDLPRDTTQLFSV